MATIFFYHLTDKYGSFSNFHRNPIKVALPAEINDKGEVVGSTYLTTEMVWDTSEHLFQALKFSQKDSSQITLVNQIQGFKDDPGKAREFANTNKDKVRPDWVGATVGTGYSLNAMRFVIKQKFAQHVKLRDELVLTGGEDIVENTKVETRWNDDFWGNGRSGTGQNWLGRILKEVREEYRVKYKYMVNTITSLKYQEALGFIREIAGRREIQGFFLKYNNGWKKIIDETQAVAKKESKWDTSVFLSFGDYFAELEDNTKPYDDKEVDKRIKEVRETFTKGVINHYYKWAEDAFTNKQPGMCKFVVKALNFYVDVCGKGNKEEQAIFNSAEWQKKINEIREWGLTIPGLSKANAKWANASRNFNDELVAEWKKAGFDETTAKQWMDIVGVGNQAIEVYNVDFYLWLSQVKKQPDGTSAMTPEWVLNKGDFAGLKKEFDTWVKAGGKLTSGSSSSIGSTASWTGSGPRPTTHTPKKDISPIFLKGLGGKTVFDLMPIDPEEKYLDTLDNYKAVGVISDKEKKDIEDYITEQYQGVEKLDPWAVGSWINPLGFPEPEKPTDPKKLLEERFSFDMRRSEFTHDEILWLQEHIKYRNEKQAWLDNQKAKITIAPAKDNTLAKKGTVNIDFGDGKGPQSVTNDGVGNVSFVFPHHYEAQPRSVYQDEGSILLRDKNFASNPRIHNPFIE